jgi:hypothetical protein
MTDNILSQSEGSGNLPGHGGRMRDGKNFSDAHLANSQEAQVPPEALRGNPLASQRIMIGLVAAGAVAAIGIGSFVYENPNSGRVERPNAVVTRDVQVQNLDMARREIETQMAARTADQVVGAAAERPAGELEQALQQERDKAQKLARELAATRRILETQATTLAETEARKGDSQQLTILQQALRDSEESTATFQELLVQERTRNQSLEQRLLTQAMPDRESVTADKSSSPGVTPAPDNAAATPSPAVDKPVIVASADNKPVSTTTPPAIPSVTSTPDVSRLLARASQLLVVGDVAAARIVLDRAVESGDLQALFALAETYDPLSLSAWGTLGTQGDVARARELYAKALAGGVQEAKERLKALGD